MTRGSRTRLVGVGLLLAGALSMPLGAEGELLPAALDAGAHKAFLPLAVSGAAPSLALAARMGGRVSAVASTGDALLVGIGTRIAPYRLGPDGGPAPSGPELALPSMVSRLTVVGERAYVVGSFPAALYVLDVGVPADPIFVGAVPVPGEAIDFLAAGDRHVLCTATEVRVVEPAAGVELRTMGTLRLDGATIRRCALAGTGGLLVASEEWRATGLPTEWRVSVVDLRVPERPMLVGDLAPEPGGSVVAVGADATSAFVLSNGGPWSMELDVVAAYSLQRVDLGDPARPRMTTVDAFGVPNGRSGSVAAAGGLVYVATPSAFRIYRVGSVGPVGSVTQSTPSHDLALLGSRAVVAGEGLTVVDVGDPARPSVEGAYSVVGEVVALAPYRDRVLALTLESTSRTVGLLEIRQDRERERARSWALGRSAYGRSLEVAAVGDVAVVLAGGLAHFVDLQADGSGAAAVLVPTAARGAYRQVAALDDGTHAVATLDLGDRAAIGVEILAVGSGVQPKRVSETVLCLDPGIGSVVAAGVATRDRQAFVAVHRSYVDAPNTISVGGTVVALDLTDLAAPRLVGAYRHRDWPDCNGLHCPGVHGVAADGAHVVLSGTGEALAVLRFEEDEGFGLLGAHPDVRAAGALALAPGLVFAAHDRGFRRDPDPLRPPGGLTVVDRTDDRRPAVQASAWPAYALDVLSSDRGAWVAAGVDGLTRYELDGPRRSEAGRGD